MAAIARYAGARETVGHRVCFLGGDGQVGDVLVAEGLADRLGLRGGWDLIGLWRLARLLRHLRPGVVHSHTHALLPTLVALLMLPGTATVYTENSPRALRPDWKFRLLYRLLSRVAARFVALTPTMRGAMERYGAPGARIEVIPNVCAIPRAATAPGRRAIPTIGVVGRVEDQKRMDLLIEVLGELRRRRIEHRGLVVGGGTRLAGLIAQADRLGLGQTVEFAGEQNDVVPWLDRMDLFLMTSAAEPFGITALEAMARRVPVVAMPCPGGLADLIERGGLLLPDRTVAAATDAVGGLLQSSEQRSELQARGQAIAAEHTVERIFPLLERMYLELAGSPSPPERQQAIA
ncbi:MAG: glycosyltransferase [Gemmatimonadales bacterium]|nr:glycosyltransferase [Gemmatimonadales bacterium]